MLAAEPQARPGDGALERIGLALQHEQVVLPDASRPGSGLELRVSLRMMAATLTSPLASRCRSATVCPTTSDSAVTRASVT